MANPRPSFQSMWTEFAKIYGDGTVISVGEKIGGKVKENFDYGKVDPLRGWTNACAVRMSYSLNHSGVIIRKGPWNTVSGGDSRQYLFRVRDLMVFLEHQFGKPDMIKKNPKPSDFSGMRGIIVFNVQGWSNATGHATLWDGSSCSDKCFFPNSIEASIWLLK